LKFDVEPLIKADDSRKKLLASIEEKRAEQNLVSSRLPQIADQEAKNVLFAEMKKLKEGLQKEEEELKEVMKEWRVLMLAVPNIPDFSVPEGDNDESNKEVKVIPVYETRYRTEYGEVVSAFGGDVKELTLKSK
jgi:seryl-tRNA synthetase